MIFETYRTQYDLRLKFVSRVKMYHAIKKLHHEHRLMAQTYDSLLNHHSQLTAQLDEYNKTQMDVRLSKSLMDNRLTNRLRIGYSSHRRCLK